MYMEYRVLRKALKINFIVFILMTCLLAILAEIFFLVTTSSSYWVYIVENGQLKETSLIFLQHWQALPLTLLITYLKLKKL